MTLEHPIQQPGKRVARNRPTGPQSKTGSGRSKGVVLMARRHRIRNQAPVKKHTRSQGAIASWPSPGMQLVAIFAGGKAPICLESASEVKRVRPANNISDGADWFVGSQQ